LVFGLLLSQLGQPASWLTQAVEEINSSLAVAEAAVNVSLTVIQTFPALVFYPLIALMLVAMLWGMLIKRSFAFQGETE
jgi:type III secretory pathway component EscV